MLQIFENIATYFLGRKMASDTACGKRDYRVDFAM